MTGQFQEARSLATTLNANFIKERRVLARRARRRNSFINLKKLIAKNRSKFGFAALCLSSGVIAGCAVALYSGAYSLNFADFSIDSFKAVEPIKPPPLAVIPLSPIDLPPVAASGDETVIRLKLSTNLSLTNPPLGENQ